MNGYQFVAPVNQPDGSVSNFRPQFANQPEAGLDNRLSATISYYDIRVVNLVPSDMEREPVNGNRFQVKDGNQTSKGLGLGAGFNYSGEQFVINNTSRKFKIPAYTVLDATIFYDQPGYRIGLKMDNINNEQYWNTSLQPQTPRRFSASLTVKF